MKNIKRILGQNLPELMKKNKTNDLSIISGIIVKKPTKDLKIIQFIPKGLKKATGG